MPDGPIADDQVPSQRQSTYASRSRQKIVHITDRFIPISHILTALTRASYRELLSLETQLLDLSDQKRKRKLVDHAAKFRAEYVKVLVLVNWATRAHEVSTAIDLRAWLHGQKNCFDNLYASLHFGLQRSLGGAKVKAPELTQASEILTTGRLGQKENLQNEWLDRPVEKLSPSKIVQTLQTLNSLITLRLMLHEVLPIPMQSFTVDSGRATFRVPGEFIVDVFFASEDLESPTLQWFMVDFRFDFGPDDNFETPLSFRLEVENLANLILGKAVIERLPQFVQLYNFLHRITLQYKLERLFNQFSRIGVREKGRIDLKYASAQKVLVVGYWLQKRHRENKSVLNSLSITIEQGQLSSRDRALATISTKSDRNRDIMTLKVRTGDQETVLEAFDVDRASASSILTAAIERRAAAAILHLYDHLIGDDFPFVNPIRIENDSGLVALSIALSFRNCLILEIDHFNGNFVAYTRDDHNESIHSTDAIVDALQASLNSLTNAREQASRVHSHRFSCLKAQIIALAESAGWSCPEFTISSLKMENLGSAFGTGYENISSKSCVFMTRGAEAWKTTTTSASWFMVCAIRPTGYSFWVAELEIDERLAKWQILWVESLRFNEESTELAFDQEPDSQFFERLWRLSTARIVYLQLSRGLAERNIDHRFVSKTSAPVWKTLQLPAIVFATEDFSRAARTWSSPLVTARISNICPDENGGLDVLFETQKLAVPEFDLSRCGDLSITTDPITQQTCFILKAFVTQPPTYIVDLFRQKWRIIENTVDIYTAVTRHSDDFYLSAIGTQSVDLIYGSDRSYVLNMEQHPESHVSINVLIGLNSTTTRSNPHQRVAVHLQKLALRSQCHFSIVLKMLLFTLPVLEVLNKLEQESIVNPEFYIMVRAVDEYRIHYIVKNVTLLLRGRPAPLTERLPEQYKNVADTALWHFTDASRSTSNTIHGQAKIDSCDILFNEGLNQKFNTDQTFPEGSGIGCSAQYAGRVLEEVHRTILDNQPVYGTTRNKKIPAGSTQSNSTNGRRSASSRPISKAKGRPAASEIIEIS